MTSETHYLATSGNKDSVDFLPVSPSEDSTGAVFSYDNELSGSRSVSVSVSDARHLTSDANSDEQVGFIPSHKTVHSGSSGSRFSLNELYKGNVKEYGFWVAVVYMGLFCEMSAVQRFFQKNKKILSLFLL